MPVACDPRYANDFFFLIFALPGIAGLFLGMQNNFNFLFWIGLGITIYGFAYFFVHDIFIHQRFKFLRNSGNNYFLAIRRAHKIHHKNLLNSVQCSNRFKIFSILV